MSQTHDEPFFTQWPPASHVKSHAPPPLQKAVPWAGAAQALHEASAHPVAVEATSTHVPLQSLKPVSQTHDEPFFTQWPPASHVKSHAPPPLQMAVPWAGAVHATHEAPAQPLAGAVLLTHAPLHGFKLWLASHTHVPVSST